MTTLIPAIISLLLLHDKFYHCIVNSDDALCLDIVKVSQRCADDLQGVALNFPTSNVSGTRGFFHQVDYSLCGSVPDSACSGHSSSSLYPEAGHAFGVLTESYTAEFVAPSKLPVCGRMFYRFLNISRIFVSCCAILRNVFPRFPGFPGFPGVAECRVAHGMMYL